MSRTVRFGGHALPSVDPSCAFRRIYHHAVGAVTQGDQYADFHIQSNWHMGSYSLGLVCALAPDDDSYGIQGITVQYRHNSEMYDWVDVGAWGCAISITLQTTAMWKNTNNIYRGGRL